MGSSLSVQIKDFSGDGEEFTKVPRAVVQATSYLYRQFIGAWQILEFQNLVDPRQMALLKEPYDE